MKHINTLGLALLFISGCGNQSTVNADRGALGTGTTAAVNQSTEALTAASGVKCTATPQTNPVVSGATVNIEVTVTNALGPITIPGYVTNETLSTYELPVTYANAGTTDLILTRTVQLTDTSSVADCSFQITVQPK